MGTIVFDHVPQPEEACRSAVDLGYDEPLIVPESRRLVNDAFSVESCGGVAAAETAARISRFGLGAREWVGRIDVIDDGLYILGVRSHALQDLVLLLYGDSCARLLDCNDDRASGDSDPQLIIHLVPGSYFVVVDGFGPYDRGAFDIVWRRVESHGAGRF